MMNLDKLVAVTGIQGLFKVVGTRNNGLIIEDLENGKRRFAPVRLHQFSPLGSIAIFTYEDAEPLKNIFDTMYQKKQELPVPSNAESNTALEAYFREILPEYDEDKVKISDIKKVVKWFHFLEAKGYFKQDLPSGESEKASEEEE
jgi:hypothetical protein